LNNDDIKEAFDCFDINKNGYISVEELRAIFKLLQEDVLDEELDEMINLADKEGDGQVNWISFYEFVSGCVSF
jgi:Ca2+-binding EF-hand superfamily protein